MFGRVVTEENKVNESTFGEANGRRLRGNSKLILKVISAKRILTQISQIPQIPQIPQIINFPQKSQKSQKADSQSDWRKGTGVSRKERKAAPLMGRAYLNE
jgi:hypothetical protein